MKSFQFSKKIALRYLWSRRSEAFITIITVISILGVAIGVTVLNVVMAVMTGFQSELRDKIVNTNSHVVVRKLGGRIYNWHEVAERIREVGGVQSVSPFTYHQALIRTPSGNNGILIRGIEQGSSAAEQLGGYLEPGEKLENLFNPAPVEIHALDGQQDQARLPGIVIGRELARSATLMTGTPVALLSAQVESSPFGLVPKYRRFVVAGTYNSGLVEYESGLAYVDLAEAQKFFKMGDSISGLEIRVKRIDDSPAIAKQIVEKLGGLSSGIYAQDWTETNKPLWDALRLEKKVYFLVLLLIVVMASFSIISTLIMIVLEKRRDIAIMKTMGASTAAIANIFRLQGAVIGALGTGIGLAGGYLGCLGLEKYGFPLDERIFQMSSLPIEIDWFNFFLVGVCAFLICCFATVYPARRASSLEPSEVLRYE